MTTLSPEHIDRFRRLVDERLGLCFDDGSLPQLASVLRQRLRKTRIAPEEYLKRLNGGDSLELRELARELTVPETYFFRHYDHFRAFAEVALPDRIRRRASRRKLRILSAGCASGEEPYSLAILVREIVPDIERWEIDILGIDVNTDLLEKALTGRYSEWSLRAVPEERRQKSFRKEGRDYVLDEDVRKMVRFEERNLVEEDPEFWKPGIFDIVFCRNATIYFSSSTTRRLIERIARALVPGGYLFLGPSETLRGISNDFHLCHTHDTFYYQRLRRNERPAAHDAVPLAHGRAMEVSAIDAGGDESWVDSIRRASERIAALTNRETAPEAKPVPAAAPVVTPASWNLEAAIELLRQERFEDAMEALRALPPEAEADPDALLLRAVVLTNAAKVAEAEAVCQKVLQLEELNAGAHYVLALCREHAGDVEGAIHHDQTAIYLDSTFAMPRLHLGLLARRRGDHRRAARELSQALLLLAREDPSRILLFGGGFNREALERLCQVELQRIGGER